MSAFRFKLIGLVLVTVLLLILIQTYVTQSAASESSPNSKEVDVLVFAHVVSFTVSPLFKRDKNSFDI